VKILFIGDIVGEPGRKAVQIIVPRLRREHALDFVIANGENSAGGNGITPPIAGELFSAGVDVITSGDHLFNQKSVMELLYSEPRFLRPLNYTSNVPGRGANVFQVRDLPPIGVMNVQGRVFMPPMENP
jgi:calcineurin-like phosphoesterase